MNDFETTVLDGIEDLQTKQKEQFDDYSRFQKETKKAIEDLTLAKNKVKDLSEVMGKIQRVQLQMGREQRLAFGDPLKKLLSNEESRLRLNTLFRTVAKLAEGGADIPNQLGGTVSRANELLRQRLGEITGKAIGEDSSPGSTLIDDVLAGEIYDTLARYGAWSTLGVRRLTTKQTKFPVKTVRPIANFILTEAGPISDDSNKAGTSVTLEVEVIGVLLNVSLQLLQDAEYDITADVMDDFIQAFNLRLDYAAFRADGSSDGTNGAMTGLLNYGTAANAAAGNTLAETLQLDDFVRCLTTVDSAVISRPSAWWCHPQMLARFLLVRDRNGRSIFLTSTEAPSRGALGSILGYPVNLVEVLPTTNAAGSKVAIFGDPNSIVVGVRTDFAFEASDDFRWNSYERSFRGIGRAGVKGRVATGSAILTTANA